MNPVCPHERTSRTDSGSVCEDCGTVLERPALSAVTGAQSPLPRRRQLELVREVRRSLHPEDGES